MPASDALLARIAAATEATARASRLAAQEAYGVDDLAQVLGVSDWTVKHHVLPHLRSFHIGARVLVRRDVLLEWMRQQEAIEAKNADLERRKIREALGQLAGTPPAYNGNRRRA